MASYYIHLFHAHNFLLCIHCSLYLSISLSIYLIHLSHLTLFSINIIIIIKYQIKHFIIVLIIFDA